MQAPLTCSGRLYPFLLNLKYWRHCCMQNNKINVSVDSKIHSRYEINWAHNYSRCKANWPITAKRNLCQSHTLLLLPFSTPPPTFPPSSPPSLPPTFPPSPPPTPPSSPTPSPPLPHSSSLSSLSPYLQMLTERSCSSNKSGHKGNQLLLKALVSCSF